jgi:hypothetical protein
MTKKLKELERILLEAGVDETSLGVVQADGGFPRFVRTLGRVLINSRGLMSAMPRIPDSTRTWRNVSEVELQSNPSGRRPWGQTTNG